jgi:hypothetical protein
MDAGRRAGNTGTGGCYLVYVLRYDSPHAVIHSLGNTCLESRCSRKFRRSWSMTRYNPPGTPIHYSDDAESGADLSVH